MGIHFADGLEEEYVKTLRDDLENGEWDIKYGHYRTQPTFSCTLRLIVSRKSENQFGQ